MEVIARLVSSMPSPRLLDVGCGAGLFFDRLAQYGHVEGVEADRSAVEQSGRWRDRIHLGHLSPDGAAFDVILLLDVLEHVDDARALLRTAASRLSPRGRMLITVPAFQCLWSSHDVLNHHVRRYSRSGLTADLEASGLNVVDARYLFQSLVAPKLGVAMLETLMPTAPRVPRIPSPLVNDILQSWVRFEHAVLGWLPFGASVLAVAAPASLLGDEA